MAVDNQGRRDFIRTAFVGGGAAAAGYLIGENKGIEQAAQTIGVQDFASTETAVITPPQSNFFLAGGSHDLGRDSAKTVLNSGEKAEVVGGDGKLVEGVHLFNGEKIIPGVAFYVDSSSISPDSSVMFIQASFSSDSRKEVPAVLGAKEINLSLPYLEPFEGIAGRWWFLVERARKNGERPRIKFDTRKTHCVFDQNSNAYLVTEGGLEDAPGFGYFSYGAELVQRNRKYPLIKIFQRDPDESRVEGRLSGFPINVLVEAPFFSESEPSYRFFNFLSKGQMTGVAYIVPDNSSVDGFAVTKEGLSGKFALSLDSEYSWYQPDKVGIHTLTSHETIISSINIASDKYSAVGSSQYVRISPLEYRDLNGLIDEGGSGKATVLTSLQTGEFVIGFKKLVPEGKPEYGAYQDELTSLAVVSADGEQYETRYFRVPAGINVIRVDSKGIFGRGSSDPYNEEKLLISDAQLVELSKKTSWTRYLLNEHGEIVQDPEAAEYNGPQGFLVPPPQQEPSQQYNNDLHG